MEVRDLTLLEAVKLGERSIDELQKIIIGLLVVMTVSMATRLYVRIGISRVFASEDWWIVAAYLFGLATCAINIFEGPIHKEVLWGNVKHYKILIKASSASTVFYILSLTAARISLGLFFLNIFIHQRGHRIFIWTIMIFTAVLALAYIPLGAAPCMARRFDFGGYQACHRGFFEAANGMFITYSVLVILGGFIFTFLGMNAVRSIPLSLGSKISAWLVLSVGMMAGIASVVRTVFTLRSTASATDAIVYAPLLSEWNIIEISLAITTANLAMVRPLITLLMIKLGLRQEQVKPGPEVAAAKPVVRPGTLTSTLDREESWAGGVKKEVVIKIGADNVVTKHVTHGESSNS